ncbi:RDD family protein [Nocardia sp. XZ_19_385]|uniref:RDD family protein n=1 Tax=Nocardia sp. XZ_19_385 TaxID=2769488 RepID=UPI00188E64F7|nr:RDD family protein [Nocardia sp. XZ_19_385]
MMTGASDGAGQRAETATVAPPAGRAFDTSATRSAIRRNMWFSWVFLLAGAACLPLTVLMLNAFDTPGASGARKVGVLAAEVTGVVGILGTVFGIAVVRISLRKRRSARRYPWVLWPINYIRAGRHEWVELLDRFGRPVSALILSTWPKDIGKLVNHKTETIWFAGNPEKYGVISRPGGADVRYAYLSKGRQPPRFSFRTDAGDGAVRQGEFTPDVSRHELVREHGKLRMKPIEEAAVPDRHGAKGDERYPSSRMLRRVLAFAFDWLVHLGVGLGLAAVLIPGFSVQAVGKLEWKYVGIALGFWLATSAVDRILLQGLFHTTIGKALFGLCVIRPDNGSFPSYGRLARVWLMNAYFSLMLPLALLGGDGPGPDNLDDYFLPAVRRRDVRPQPMLDR